MGAMSYLIMHRGPESGKIFHLDMDDITIGRGTKNTIIINDNEVSRIHLRLTRVDEGYQLDDMNSSNGTFINGQRVEEVWLLQSRCIIELGDSITLEYRLEDPSEETEQDDGEEQQDIIQPYLVVMNTSMQEEPAVYPISGALVIVGRSTSSGIVVVEPELSRQHFRIMLTGDGYYIEDLNSTNGTRVNGEWLTDEPRKLNPDDIIQVGEIIRFKFTDSPEESVSAMQTEIIDHQDVTMVARKTNRSDVSDVFLAMSKATKVNVGLDNVTLEDNVLISYVHDDWSSIVAPLVDKLTQDDIKIWVDQYMVEDSDDWQRAIEQARLECWMLVVVVSPTSMRSELVKKNLRHFQNREKPIILIIHEMVDQLPLGTSKLLQIQHNPGIPEIAFQQLVDEIKRFRSYEFNDE
jgi:pSer/pThr/pTyr-binding forkhead associated (FHA) protein